MSNKKYLFVALSGAIASMFVGCQSDAIELAGDEGANEYTIISAPMPTRCQQER